MSYFYEVSRNHEVSDIRKIFKEKNDKMKIFCPECQEAKLFIRGKDKTKFIVDQPTSAHAAICSYNKRPLNFKEAKDVFSNNNVYKIEESMVEVFKKRQAKNFIGNVCVDYKTKTKTLEKVFPLINIEDVKTEMLNNANVYYGRATIELIKSQKGYIIKLSAPKSEFQYFIINVSENTYKYLDKRLIEEKVIKDVDFMYYGILTLDSKKWKISTLVNSKYLIF